MRWLVAVLLPSIAWATPTLAVLDLDNLTGDPSLDSAGAGVAAVLTTKLTRVDAVTVVERSRLLEVLAEVDLGQSGAVDPTTAARAGALLGADYLVMGSLFSVQLPAIAIDLRIIDASTGQVVQAEQVQGSIGETGEEFFVLLDDLSSQVLSGMDITLGARDRIRLSQVDVERLSTVSVYGEALQALDAGNASEARGLLAQASALEPGFTLAAATLAGIRDENTARQTTIAHDGLVAYRAALDTLEASIERRFPSGDVTSETLAAMALSAHLHLMKGEVDTYLRLELEREALMLASDADGALRDPHGFSRAKRQILQDEVGHAKLVQHMQWVHFWPHEAREERAKILAKLGRRDAAMALIIDNYQHPGPGNSAVPRPTPPMRFARDIDLYDMYVVLKRQQVQQLELRGDESLSRESTRLQRVIDSAVRSRERAGTLDALQTRLNTGPITADLVDEELGRMDWIDDDEGFPTAYYSAFRDRVAAGAYSDVSTEEDFYRVCREWGQVMRDHFRHPMFFEQRLDVMLQAQAMAPARDDEEAARYARDIRSIIDGHVQ